jgi:hypothetical protein
VHSYPAFWAEPGAEGPIAWSVSGERPAERRRPAAEAGVEPKAQAVVTVNTEVHALSLSVSFFLVAKLLIYIYLSTLRAHAGEGRSSKRERVLYRVIILFLTAVIGQSAGGRSGCDGGCHHTA